MEDSARFGGNRGQYANSLYVGYNDLEFVLDFGQAFPGEGDAGVVRIITSPAYARRFLEAFERAWQEYEHTHGPAPEG